MYLFYHQEIRKMLKLKGESGGISWTPQVENVCESRPRGELGGPVRVLEFELWSFGPRIDPEPLVLELERLCIGQVSKSHR